MYPELVTLNQAENDLLVEPSCHDFTVMDLKISRRREDRGSADMLCVPTPI